MFNFTALPPLTLYIHIPWCVRKCPYCDFNSHEAKSDLPEADYIAALIADVEQELPRIWGRRIDHIFIGGGTPSLFSPAAFDLLFSQLRARLQISPTAEITLEANPGTFEREKFAEYRAIGINRLSLGIQSFNDDHLKSLGRIHGRREAIKAAEAAHAVGFANFNLDLMFGLPNQTPQEALSDLQMAIDLEPTHLSYYQLTLEPNTLFFRHPPPLPEDDTIHLIHEQGQERLAEAGYQQYETSAYAQAKQACQHNLNYWRFGDYVGIGAGAHGKITDAFQQNISRTAKSRHPKEYLDESQRHTTVNVLTRHEAAVEFMMNALRLNDGFATTLFAERVGLPINIVEKPLRQAEERGLIQWDIQQIRPTERGRRYLNNLLELFV